MAASSGGAPCGITFATTHCGTTSRPQTSLDAGVALRDVQDYARHKDPRTTRRYDHSHDSLDRNAAYTVAAHLG
jgi:hypothetical protein